ncbi:MAG: Gfo/Idh/MocA family oxidoreductase, partial [Paracoccaceae bacterium]
MRLCVAGAYGAFGMKHLDALDNIEGVTVTSVMGPSEDKIKALAESRGIGHSATDLNECLKRDDVDAVILATPTQLHAEQAIASMRAGKPVLIEIPMADSLADSEEICRVQKETGVLAMAGQVRRFNPSHQWIHTKIAAGELKVQQMDVQTYFFRR